MGYDVVGKVLRLVGGDHMLVRVRVRQVWDRDEVGGAGDGA